MQNSTLEAETGSQVHQLPLEQQRQVLEFARTLATARGRGRGAPGKTLLQFVGTISLDDLAIMTKIIEESCEQVERDGW